MHERPDLEAIKARLDAVTPYEADGVEVDVTAWRYDEGGRRQNVKLPVELPEALGAVFLNAIEDLRALVAEVEELRKVMWAQMGPPGV